MLKDKNENKYCNCSFSSNKEILKTNIYYSFCSNCGSILIKTLDNKICYTLKPKQKIKKVEFNPIESIKNMKQKTENEYPYLNEEYNMANGDKLDKENVLKSIKLYLKNRKIIILTLQKMMKMLDFTDLIFYQCLFYMDTFLSHIITEDFTEKIIIYYLVGFFLCSAKSKETDIYEPSLDLFCYIKKRDHLPIDKIAYYEVLCLKSIKYNIFCYSAYDWILELSSIGFVFNCEINDKNSIILINGHNHSIVKIISKNTFKMLLNITIKNIFIKYSPMYIAFSLIQISREKYLDKSFIKPELYNNLMNLFGVKFNDYKKCYQEIKEEITEKPKENNKIIEIGEKEDIKAKNNKEKNSHSEKFKLLHIEEDLQDLPSKNNYIIDKNLSMANKMKSCITLPNLGEFTKNLQKEEIKTKNNEDNNDNSMDSNNKNNIDNNKNDDDNKSKDDNIIIYDENYEEKNKDLAIDFNLELNINKKPENEANSIGESKNKIKSSQVLNRLKIKNKNHLYINCNTHVFKSNDNLPKINKIMEHNLNNLEKRNDNKINNLKRTSFNNSPNNMFLKSNRKNLKPIQTKTISNSTDNKRYHKSNSIHTINNNIQKEELNLMRKSLFYDKSNFNKKENNNEIVVINKSYKKMRSDLPKQNITFKKIIKENINDSFEEIESKNINNDNNEKNNKSKQCKSKSKLKNNFVGKETKAYVINKRNQSTNNKKRTIQRDSNVNNIVTSINNFKWKNM